MLVSILGFSQGDGIAAPVVLKGKITNATDKAVILSSYDGQQLTAFCIDTLKEDGTFFMNCNLPSKDIFYLRFDGNKQLNVILQINDTITVNSDAHNYIKTTEISGSQPSEAIWTYMIKYSVYSAKIDSARAYLKAHPGADAQVNESFKPISTEWMTYRNQFIQLNSNSPALIATLNGIEEAQEPELRLQILEKLNEIYSGTPTGNNIAIQYNQAKVKWESAKLTAEGSVAIDIIQADTAGVDRKLSDLKGKVVLLDFWASWCGPCRKENPNVVKLYHKYKEKGFTVFSVSFDQQKAKWLSAIKSDGLIWPDHVSDLKGWGNAAGKQYGVSSIPTTYLLDAEGRIIGKNLRGYALEQKLQEIFGF